MSYLENNAVKFSFINDEYIICYSSIGSFSLKFIWNIETNERNFVRETFKTEELMVQVIEKIIDNLESK